VCVYNYIYVYVCVCRHVSFPYLPVWFDLIEKCGEKKDGLNYNSRVLIPFKFRCYKKSSIPHRRMIHMIQGTMFCFFLFFITRIVNKRK